MAANIAYRNWSAGEVSPNFYAATDRAAYARGLRTCRNATVMPKIAPSTKRGPMR